MELRHLRYFVAVADEGSFTRAASRLNTVQPSLSRQIRDLEEHVGARLLERTSRRISLTAAGVILLAEARLLLEHSEMALERVRQAAKANAHSLSLGFVPGVEIEELPRVMGAVGGSLGSGEIVLRSLPSPLLISALRERRVDAGFIRPSKQSQGLMAKIIRRERLIVALPVNHPLAAEASLNIRQLVGAPMIGVSASDAPVLFDIIQTYAARHGVEFTSAYESENLVMALSLISTAGGICLLPQRSTLLFPKGVVAVELDGDAPTIELALAWHHENTSPALSAFLQHFA
ncbi:LysR family transcriptional regulator (plasmid) [Mesorhizobium sp. AR02]|uniref:LysR substrate-binding domain-containing protein n=1 Tax=Mesorhizobium sp. AR02 TaxID=2865837 RepID=UPI00215EAC43|nr:LysR substrate-binding domain-containing protein [Mesorhizobium sp. AR02]UVK49715.1 LysR family transcriptional regulator [Mesorhizobium sp. AR02]